MDADDRTFIGADAALASVQFFPLGKALPEGGPDAADDAEPPWIFEGIASDESQDVDGDEILRRSLDLSYAASRGFVNWDHSPEPEHQIGYLQKAELIQPGRVKAYEDRLGAELSKSASVFVRGELYKYVAKSQAVANMLRSSPAGRGVGLSLQGALARDAKSGNVLKAFVRGVAITPVPAHPNTMALLVKSLCGAASGAGLSAEGAVPGPIRQYIEDRLVEFAKAAHEAQPSKLTRDEAIRYVARHWPDLPYRAVEAVVDHAIREET